MADLSRRHLIKTAALVAGAGAGAGVSTSTLAQSAPAFSAGSEGQSQGRHFARITADGSDVRALSLQQGFNRRWFAGNCEVIYLCYDTEGVATALEEVIQRYGRRFSIKSGGHCYENFVFNPKIKAIIDTSALNQMLHTDHGYTLGAGCSNWDTHVWLLREGLCLPAGSCYSVGLGGHICGGGFGLLSRLHGLTVDWLSAVTLVVLEKNGTPVIKTVSKNSADADERDLFWAHTGGGGGNFGVITAYHFETLPKAPEAALIGNLAWQWADVDAARLGALLDVFAELSNDAPREFFGLFNLNHISAGGQFNLVYQIVSSEDIPVERLNAASRSIERQMTDIAAPVASVTPIIGQMCWLGQAPAKSKNIHTYYEALQQLNGSGPNQRSKYKSAYMKKAFPFDQVEKIHHWLTTQPDDIAPNDTAQTLVQVDSYGGAVNDVAGTDTAIAHRESIMKLQYQSYWVQNRSEPGDKDDRTGRALVRWLNDSYADIYSEYGGVPDPSNDSTGTVDGCYYNYPDIELSRPPRSIHDAMELYFKQNFKPDSKQSLDDSFAPKERHLMTIKNRWDPGRYFVHGQSIPFE
ncbi:Aclacinomycin-N/aclacinomycin-A oxidase [BD1-7 clade bacterium]|nr:Aclacinomycin-N/aclacinomycin-A oxidase [BD1-7 clade bacterium]